MADAHPLDAVDLDANGVPAGAANVAYVRAVHDRGLAFDLNTMTRRSLLGLAGGLGALALVGCGTTSTTSSSSSTAASTSTLLADSSTASSAASSECATEINSETAGPYPADGSNGTEIRTVSGVVRNDIRSSFGSSTGTAEGVPLTITLILEDLSCTPIAGAAVYLWHCDRSGNYSLYSSAITDQNYLRGIAETDASGAVSFTSIFPACYSGRWPHIHFEVYGSLADATSGSGTIIKTSQVAIPEDVLADVYATDGYSQSVSNLSQVTLESDNVFGDDGAAHQLGTVTGSVANGYTVTLTVPVDPSDVETGGSMQGGPGGTPPSGMGGPGGTPPSGMGGPGANATSSG